MLTRIRNASRARHDKTVMPVVEVQGRRWREVLKDEGFIADYIEHERKPQNEITVVLKYGPNREPAITGIKRVSKPGLRRYANVRDIPHVIGGLGIAILSTSKGVLVDADARKQKRGRRAHLHRLLTVEPRTRR